MKRRASFSSQTLLKPDQRTRVKTKLREGRNEMKRNRHVLALKLSCLRASAPFVTSQRACFRDMLFFVTTHGIWVVEEVKGTFSGEFTDR